MNDLELLVMAAKAAGIQHVDYENVDYDGCAGLVIVGEHGQHLHGWNPLADDGDALRLAAKLGLELNTDGRGLGAHTIQGTKLQEEAHATAPECSEADHMRLLRRCIVRAAAEIGSKMP
jgi:hypothetical protein